MKYSYIPLFLSGIVVVIGLNVVLAIRDTQLFEAYESYYQEELK